MGRKRRGREGGRRRKGGWKRKGKVGKGQEDGSRTLRYKRIFFSSKDPLWNKQRKQNLSTGLLVLFHVCSTTPATNIASAFHQCVYISFQSSTSEHLTHQSSKMLLIDSIHPSSDTERWMLMVLVHLSASLPRVMESPPVFASLLCLLMLMLT